MAHSHLGGSKLTWLGHATIHIETAGGTSILVDPWFEGNPSSPKNYKLPEKIDLLLLTHGHDDHFHVRRRVVNPLSGVDPVQRRHAEVEQE